MMGIQLLGHAMGYDAVNLIQPYEVHHNTYILLVGKSTVSRKSTIQTLSKNVTPFDKRMSEETSPEQFMVELSADPERIQFLGEFTGLIKGLVQTSYMSRFVELYNDLHGCPETWERKLRQKQGAPNVFKVEKSYLSLNSTTTPEMLKECITEEFSEGGFLARWLLVEETPRPKPRSLLRKEIIGLREIVTSTFDALYQMKDRHVNFVLTEAALDRFNKIEMDCYKRFEQVLPFAGRYLNYIIAVADILYVSDIFYHRMTDENKFITDYKSLNEYLGYVKGDEVKIEPEYIDRAWVAIEPSLTYATSLVDYIERDKPTAKLMLFLRAKKLASHADCMNGTKLNAKDMASAIQTLNQSNEIEIIQQLNAGYVGRAAVKTLYKWIGKPP
jgi:hypothetical protein